MMRTIICLVLCALILPAHSANFTIINGQIFTPGLAIIDAPQPFTPLGGDFLQVAIDISGDGKLQLPPYPANAPTGFHNITIFLTSYVTGLNFTITNGTAGISNASLGDILYQEPSSTVKHVNWIWPDCLVGNGPPKGSNSSRGAYNISIHQSFTLNATNFYTIFTLPISITNSIPANTTATTSSSSISRPSCPQLQNPLRSQAALDASTNLIPPNQYPWTNGGAVQTVISGGSGSGGGGSGSGSGSGSGTSTVTGTGTATGAGTSTATTGTGLGSPKPDATAGGVLGSGAGRRAAAVVVGPLTGLGLGVGIGIGMGVGWQGLVWLLLAGAVAAGWAVGGLSG